MKVAIVADVFPPLRSSGAVQLRDLANEFVRQGHETTVFVASPGQKHAAVVEKIGGVKVVRLRSPQAKDLGYVRRAFAELTMPFAMLASMRRGAIPEERWDGVIWYSPTIFLAPFARALMKSSGCRGYLIVRDLFPDWAVDMGIMSKGLAYRFLKKIEHYQYTVADVIGVQTPANLPHFASYDRRPPRRRVEVLQNWLADAPAAACSIDVSATAIAGRCIFVYAGNMGVAQGMGTMIELAEHVRIRRDVGFLFVGRGSEALTLRQRAQHLGLDNVVFFDEIEPAEIPGLYAQCHVGLVALDPRHRTHNVPGKFLSYMHAGLPVLACINPGNDLVSLISNEKVGRVTNEPRIPVLADQLEQLVDDLRTDSAMAGRCRQLAQRMFSPETAVRQIVSALGK